MSTIFRLLHTVLILSAVLTYGDSWRRDRAPKVFGDKVPNHLISTQNPKVQRRIVMLHDYFRTKVEPPASNMLRMKWNRGAARTAQKWAEKCRFLVHDSPDGRHVDPYGSCGQNIFVSTHKVPWLFALRTWFIERQNFTYGGNKNILKDIGHYTQMVWAASHKVGCGIAKCPYGQHNKTYYNYVCNYCPTGNLEDRIQHPYKMGSSCSSCRGSCLSKKIRLCTNTCNTVDKWANCAELYKTWPGWLCNEVTPKGLDRQRSCHATCTCHGKIYD